jgi:heparosan-N-sulfate-glucuronate 5-epimerase
MSGAVRVAGESRRTRAGVLSSAKSFFLPLGPAIDPDGVRGYPIDLRVKARSTSWPPPEVALGPRYVAAAQYGLGAHERWIAGEGKRWLAVARQVGEFLLAEQESDGSWLHRDPFAHTFPLPAPWRCGLAQGEAASLLVRLHSATGEEAFAEAAVRALRPLSLPREAGGVCAQLGGRPWPEEYPTARPSFVLNGAIFALWGVRDVAVAFDDAGAGTAFVDGVDAVAANLHRFDTGWWSLYSLYPHPLRGVASSFYHDLHIVQLAAMDLLAPRPEFAPTRQRWARYAGSAWCRRRAFASKAVFRLIVPRNRLLAHRLPWMRP